MITQPLKFLLAIALASGLFLTPIAMAKSADNENSQSENVIQLPPFKLLRAEENYSFLHGSQRAEDNFWASLKNIELSDSGNSSLSLGGEFRIRGEHFENRGWQSGSDETFWSHRVALHANLQFGSNLRFFGELYHGYTSHQKAFAEYDELNLHQGFAEYSILLSGDKNIAFRAGRQELAFGSARLMGMREGPNIRRSFDAGKITYTNKDTAIHGFYGREVLPRFGVFDNSSNLFAKSNNNPEVWGIYSRFKIKGLLGNNELYYLGFDVNQARFNDVSGHETRHTLGLRRFGRIGERFKYNTELMYQFGTIGTADISAFNIEADWRYTFPNSEWRPELGVKFEWSSGDNAPGDNKINSYNPMFVNPEYYGLAKIITPSNVVSIRPFISLDPNDKLNLYLEYAKFWRESDGDGLYRVTRFLLRVGGNNLSRDLGEQIGFRARYEIDRNWSMDLDASLFWAGEYLEQSGAHENILHIAPTLRFRF